jgi:hypothetical protein
VVELLLDGGEDLLWEDWPVVCAHRPPPREKAFACEREEDGDSEDDEQESNWRHGGKNGWRSLHAQHTPVVRRGRRGAANCAYSL